MKTFTHRKSNIPFADVISTIPANGKIYPFKGANLLLMRMLAKG